MLNPVRKAFGKKEQLAALKVIHYYNKSDDDIPYFGFFEKEFIKKFSDYQGGGYSKAVSTGTASAYVSIQSLFLPKRSEIILSPFVDAGVLNSIIALDYKAVICDTSFYSYNIDLEQIKKKITNKTSAVFLVHSAGQVVKDIIEIKKFLKKKNIYLIEDISQCPGGSLNNQKVGSFGDISCSSTMYRKSLYSGSSGGVVFTKSKTLYKNILAFADRGKILWSKKYDFRDPSKHLFPALNWNSNEFSCSIAIESLKRLDKTISSRYKFYKKISKLIKNNSKNLRTYEFCENDSIFFIPIYFINKVNITKKIKFANKLKSKGVGLNEHYKFLISDWHWAKKFIKCSNLINANNFRNQSFNLFVNENYNNSIAHEITEIITEIEKNENEKKYFLW